jgi:hypothetical protein
MPATIVLLLSMMCPPLFLENAIEMQLIEGIIGLPTIVIYIWIMQATEQRPANDMSVSLEQRGLVQIRKSLQAGIALWAIGILGLCGLLMILLMSVVDIERILPRSIITDHPRPAALIKLIRKRKYNIISIIPALCWLSVIFNLARMAVGMGIWSSVGHLGSTIFCPRLSTTGFIAGVSILLSLADHLLRASFCVGSIKWLRMDGVWEPLREGSGSSPPLDTGLHSIRERGAGAEVVMGMRELVDLGKVICLDFHTSELTAF